MELLDGAPSRPTHEGPASPPSTPARPPRPSLQERLESSRGGRWVLSLFLAATVSVVVLWNLPESGLQNATAPVLEPVVNLAGLDQRWNLFAPNPPRRTVQTLARIEYADGSLVLWQPPRNDRWRKWLGAIPSERSKRLWEPTAAWIANHHDSGGRRPVRVELILRTEELPPPGSIVPGRLPQDNLFFTYDVPGSGTP